MIFEAIGGSGVGGRGPGRIRGVRTRWERVGDTHDIADEKEIEICMRNPMLKPIHYIPAYTYEKIKSEKDAQEKLSKTQSFAGFNPAVATIAMLRSYCYKNKLINRYFTNIPKKDLAVMAMKHMKDVADGLNDKA